MASSAPARTASGAGERRSRFGRVLDNASGVQRRRKIEAGGCRKAAPMDIPPAVNVSGVRECKEWGWEGLFGAKRELIAEVTDKSAKFPTQNIRCQHHVLQTNCSRPKHRPTLLKS